MQAGNGSVWTDGMGRDPDWTAADRPIVPAILRIFLPPPAALCFGHLDRSQIEATAALRRHFFTVKKIVTVESISVSACSLLNDSFGVRAV